MSVPQLSIHSSSSQVHPPESPWKSTLRSLNQSFGRDWSFRILSHQVRRRDILVLGELATDGEVRQLLGVARIGKDIGESVREAAYDALVQCGRLFLEGEGQPAHPPPSPLRLRLQRIRDAIERLPGGEAAFRGVLRQFQVTTIEAILEEDLPGVIAYCEEVYRVAPPANGRSQVQL